MYDCIIVGSGPAGMSASIYAQRSGMKTLLLEKEVPGGLLNKTNEVDNYLGLENISGPDLAKKMFEHTKEQQVLFKTEEVIDIDIKKNIKIVTTNKNKYETKTIILCGGRQSKKTGINKLNELEGRGVSYCSVCDAPLFKGKKVAVIGAGNSAFEEGIYISEFASELYILCRKDKVSADKVLVKDAKKKKNIKILLNTSIKEVIVEEEVLKGVILNNGKTLNVDGLFVYIGYSPSSTYLRDLDILNEKGYIKVNKKQETKVSGIYAAGDITSKNLYQIVTATSEGAVAAVQAKKYVSELTLDKK